jgi:hypothetical protein
MAAAAVVAVVVAVIAAEVAAKVAVKVVVVLRVAVVVGGGGGWWWMVNVKVKTATATATATAHKQLKKKLFTSGPPARRTPAWGSPAGRRVRRWLSTAKEEHVCARVWACLACVCCGCVCGSGVRQAHAPFVETGCSHCLAYARPRRGLGSREGTPSLMLLHQRACEISRSRASFTKVYRPKVIDQPRG